MTPKNSSVNTKYSREAQLAASRFQWSKQLARPEQLPPDDFTWDCYLYLAGRGAGKTRTAAEWIAWQAMTQNKTRWAVIAPTMQSCISVCIEGESGLLSVFNRYGFKYDFLRSRGEILLENGSLIALYSAEEPERMRGPQFHGAWFDELAAFTTTEIYDLALPALRLGKMPQHIITTTPKPIALIVNLARVPNEFRIVRRGSTFDNEKNLASSTIRTLKERFGNSRQARQELHGEILNQLDGALFLQDYIDKFRSNEKLDDLYFYKVVIGVDPAVTFGEESNLTGIVVVGLAPNGHCYVLEDASMRGRPEDWAKKVSELYEKYTRGMQSPTIVAESNNGGELVAAVLKQANPMLRVKLVNATRGKELRAEPVSIAYSQGLVHHLGIFPELENEMLYWIPGISRTSPDRLDALVWAITELKCKDNSVMNYFMNRANICSRCGTPFKKQFLVCPSCNQPINQAY